MSGFHLEKIKKEIKSFKILMTCHQLTKKYLELEINSPISLSKDGKLFGST